MLLFSEIRCFEIDTCFFLSGSQSRRPGTGATRLAAEAAHSGRDKQFFESEKLPTSRMRHLSPSGP